MPQLLPARLILLAALLCLPSADAGVIFSILLKPSDDPNQPAPQEYFEEMQMVLSEESKSEGGGGVFGPDSGFAFLSKVDTSQDLSDGVVTLQECDLDPFWEKGKIVSDLKDCPLSMVKVVVYSLVPAVAMFFGLIGLWSRQRNVGGRGRDTQIGGIVSLGISILSVAYDWFFGWELFRNPRPGFQVRFSEFGLAHLIACAVINFLMVHFWFRRKFLVGMPWYEYHKHGIALHLMFALMYAQPQSIVLFHSRLFNSDVFNIHFGTPSKMNEVLSNIGLLSMLEDLPQFILQLAVWMADVTGRDAPKVSRVSMALSCVSIAIVLKRQYVASVERQWYKEIVRMAGVKRLSVYGGASRWLKFQKRPSAAKDVKGASTSQQQLFLAWMQSMGRRQESIFDNEDGGQHAIEDDASEDSEDDLDSLSDSSADEDEEGSGSGSGSGAGSEGGEGGESEDGHEGSESEDALSSEGEGDNAEVELQSYAQRKRDADRRRRRPAEEESPFASRRRTDGSDVDSGLLSSEGGLLGFARGVADNVSGTTAHSAASESDIFAFAKHVAGRASDSGVLTESTENLNARSRSGRSGRSRARRDEAFAQADVFSESGDGMLGFARGVADDISQVSTSEAGSQDIFNYARQAAQGISESGAGGSVGTGGSDIWAFARGAANDVSVSGVERSDGGASDIFAFARNVADRAMDGGASSVGPTSTAGGDSDIFGFALKAAGQISQSGVGGSEASGGDVMAAARQAAGDASASGVGTSMGSGSDIFAFAAGIANDVSQSGVGSSVAARPKALGSKRPAKPPARQRDAPSEGGSEVSDIFALARKAAEDAASGAASSAGTESDIFAMARRAAGEISESGVGTKSRGGMSDIFVQAKGSSARGRQAQQPDEISGVSSQSDIFAAAQNAAMEFSQSGAGASRSGVRSGAFPMNDIFANVGQGGATSSSAKAPPPTPPAQEAGSDSESDIFEAVQRMAAATSASGVASSASAVRSKVRGGMDNIFAQVGAPPPPAAGGGRGRLPASPDRLPPKSPSAAAPDDVSLAGSSEMDLFALARGAADDLSGVQSSIAPSRATAGTGGIQSLFGNTRRGEPPPSAPARNDDSQSGVSGGDLFALARGVADDLSGVQSSIAQSRVTAGTGGIQSMFGNARRGEPPPSAPARNDDSQSGVSGGSDIFGAALGAAAEMSVVSGADTDSDIFGAALGAAGDMSSQSGVGSRSMASQSGIGGMNDIFASARRAAGATSDAGSASQSGVGSGSDIFAIAQRAAQVAPQAQRRFAPEGRHSSAPPLNGMVTDSDQPPWAVIQAVPPAPPKPQRRPPSPPGTPPPFDSIPLVGASAGKLLDAGVGRLPKLQDRPPSPPGTPPPFDTIPAAGTGGAKASLHSPPPVPRATPAHTVTPVSGARQWMSLAGCVTTCPTEEPQRRPPLLQDVSQHAVESLAGGQMLRFAREIAAAADPAVVAPSAISSPEHAAPDLSPSSSGGLEGLFLHRRGAARRGSNDNPKVSTPAAGPPELPPKLRIPLTSASSAERPPSPSSLRRLAESERQRHNNGQKQQRGKRLSSASAAANSSFLHAVTAANSSSSSNQQLPPTQAQPEDGEVVEPTPNHGHAAERNSQSNTNQACPQRQLSNGSSSAAYYDPALERRRSQPSANVSTPRAKQGRPLDSGGGDHTSNTAYFNISYSPDTSDDAREAPTQPDGGNSSGNTAYFMLTQSPQLDTLSDAAPNQNCQVAAASSAASSYAVPPGTTMGAALLTGATPPSLHMDDTDHPRSPKPSLGNADAEDVPKTPTRQTTDPMSDQSPPGSPSQQAAARQQRLQLRQARLRDGVQDRDYKRKHARVATYDPEKPE